MHSTVKRPIPIIPNGQQALLRTELTEVIEYRKSGLSLNHIIGCPLDCAYCVRHLFDNYEMKVPRALMTDEEAVDALIGHEYFQRDLTPVQVFNRATDPMLPRVKPHTFNVLRLLDEQRLTNHVLVITRWRIDDEDCQVLNSFNHLKVTVLVTHSGIDDSRIEPVDSTIAAESLKTAYRNAERYRVVLYWRPIVPGLNDTDDHLERAHRLAAHAHATVFTGLFFRHQIQAYYRSLGLPEPYPDTARRKILPKDMERRILDAFPRGFTDGGPLFRKTSCAVSFAHGLPDYNGHYGIRELCEICPIRQLALCKQAWEPPNPGQASAMAERLGGDLIEVNDRAIVVQGLSEQPRYLMQHTLGYQVHDVAKPHHYQQHGRAGIGWDHPEAGG